MSPGDLGGATHARQHRRERRRRPHLGTHEPLEELQLAELRDEEVLGDRVDLTELCDGRPVIAVDTVVHDVERSEMLLGGRTAEVEIVPGPAFDERARRSDRNTAECGDPFGNGIDHLACGIDLRVEHLVDCDEVRARHVPVHVLESEREIDQADHSLVENRDDLARRIFAHSGNGERRGGHDVAPVLIAEEDLPEPQMPQSSVRAKKARDGTGLDREVSGMFAPP